MRKYGVEFVSRHHRSITLRVRGAWDKTLPYSFQVRRSAFDEFLMRNAAAKGAEMTGDAA